MPDRYEYLKGRLAEEDASPNPLEQFAHWLQAAISAQVIEPTATCLSTVGSNGRPSSRIVLLRGQDERGFTFFTNYQSRKGEEIEAHRYGCMNFWWGALERQIRIEGVVERVLPEDSDAYWQTRPYESQLASAASPQSQVVDSRESLTAHVHHIQQENPDTVARPEHWGGYRLVPDRFEFWQGGPARLHDRLVYRLVGQAWIIERLAP